MKSQKCIRTPISDNQTLKLSEEPKHTERKHSGQNPFTIDTSKNMHKSNFLTNVNNEIRYSRFLFRIKIRGKQLYERI